VVNAGHGKKPALIPPFGRIVGLSEKCPAGGMDLERREGYLLPGYGQNARHRSPTSEARSASGNVPRLRTMSLFGNRVSL